MTPLVYVAAVIALAAIIAAVSAAGGLAGWGLGLVAGALAIRYFTEWAALAVDVDPIVAFVVR